MSKNDGVQYVQTMSLRDWFAGQAVCGMIGGKYTADGTIPGIAAHAYAIADAMLEARDV